MVVELHDALADGLVEDGREGRRGVVELTAHLHVKVIRGHTQQLGGVAALAGQTLDGQVAEAHALELTCASRGVLQIDATAPKQQGVRGVAAEFVLAAAGHLDVRGDGGVGGPQLLDDGRPDVLQAVAARDVVLRVDVEITAHGGDLRDAGALRLNGPLLLSGGVGGGGGVRSSGGGSRRLLLTLFCLNFRAQGVDFPLQGIELGLFLGGQGAVGASRGIDKGLLALGRSEELLLLAHCFVPPYRFLFI